MQEYRIGRYDPTVVDRFTDYMNTIRCRGQITMLFDESINPNIVDDLQEIMKTETYRHYAKQRLIRHTTASSAFHYVEKQEIPKELRKYLMPDEDFPAVKGRLTFGMRPREVSKQRISCELLVSILRHKAEVPRKCKGEVRVNFINLTFARGAYVLIKETQDPELILNRLDMNESVCPEYLDRLQNDSNVLEKELGTYKKELDLLSKLLLKTSETKDNLSLFPVDA